MFLRACIPAGAVLSASVLGLLIWRAPASEAPVAASPDRETEEPRRPPPLRLEGRSSPRSAARPSLGDLQVRPPATPQAEASGCACVRGRRAANRVFQGLRWLQAHQSPDGRWEAAGFARWCEGRPDAATNRDRSVDGAGSPHRDVGVTALALLAHLGAGYSTRGGDNPFKETMLKALRWLRDGQDARGGLAPDPGRGGFLDHTWATLALLEVYGRTRSALWHDAAQRALDFTVAMQDHRGAWRGSTPRDDLVVTVWAVAALTSARLANERAEKDGKMPPLRLEHGAFDAVRTWLEGIAPHPSDLSRPDLVRHVFLRIFLLPGGEKDAWNEQAAPFLALQAPTDPTWSDITAEEWFLGMYAAFQLGGTVFPPWNEAFSAALETQHKGDEPCGPDGSFDPSRDERHEVGRVGASALMTMATQVCYRYDTLMGP